MNVFNNIKCFVHDEVMILHSYAFGKKMPDFNAQSRDEAVFVCRYGCKITFESVPMNNDEHETLKKWLEELRNGRS